MLVDNARRLPSRQESMPIVAGTDELAYLDSALHQASEQLRQAEEHRRSVMEMVAHDMRSPLMAAQVSTEILNHSQSESLTADTEQMLETVRRYINQVLKLVNELLTIERFEAGKVEFEMTRFAVRGAVDDAISRCEELVDFDRVSVRNDCGGEVILADKDKLEQLIINFISTIRSFPGGANEIAIKSDHKSDAVIMSVTAAGPALDRSLRTALFKSFPRVGNTSRAGDLGLTICQLIAKSHGGAVGLDETDCGNSLWARFPLDANPDKTPVTRGASRYFTPYKSTGWFGSRVIHKGILLVIVPLCLESFWICLLHQEMQVGEEQARTVQRLTDTLLNGNSGLNATFEVAVATADYGITGNPKLKQRARAVGQEARTVYQRLKEITSGYPEEARIVDLFDYAMMKPMEMQLQVAEQPRQGLMASASVFRIFMNYSKAMSYVAANYESLFAREKAELDRLRTQQAKSTQSLQTIVATGLAANFLLALLMVLLFNVHITRRLKILVTNASNLPEHKPLLKELNGLDELAYLDFILHRTSEEIDEAARQRQAIVELIVQDMRSPLTSARDTLKQIEPLLRQTMSESAPNHVLSIEGNIERILRLVDDLLTLEYAEKGKINIVFEPFDVRQAVDEAIAALASLARHRQINVVNQCENYVLNGDKARVVQVLLNFLSNALKFSPQKTQITALTKTEGNLFQIGIRDEGAGIDAQAQKQLFEKFFQAHSDEKKRGFGLGLAICRLIAESHGGSVGVNSELGRGSTFWLRLPIRT